MFDTSKRSRGKSSIDCCAILIATANFHFFLYNTGIVRKCLVLVAAGALFGDIIAGARVAVSYVSMEIV